MLFSLARMVYYETVLSPCIGALKSNLTAATTAYSAEIASGATVNSTFFILQIRVRLPAEFVYFNPMELLLDTNPDRLGETGTST